MKYVIQDWAGNVLDFKVVFKIPSLAVPMKFKTFDDAWDWVYTNITDETEYENLYVEKI